MAHIPEVKKKPFYEKKWFAEVLAIPTVLLTGIPVLLTGIPIIINYDAPENKGKMLLTILSVIGIAWLVIVGVVKVMQGASQDKEEKQKFDYDGLRATLFVLYGLVSRNQGFRPDELEGGRLRVTIHRVVPSKNANGHSEELEQLIPYIGGSGGDSGRRFSIRSGIIGKAVREGEPYTASRENDNYNAYLRELVSQWSYTQADANKLSADRMSWMAVPIFYKNKEVEAVVYLDSSEKDFFSNEVQNLIIYTCEGIASYIKERYK